VLRLSGSATLCGHPSDKVRCFLAVKQKSKWVEAANWRGQINYKAINFGQKFENYLTRSGSQR
jgi:hypothetical protein